MKITSKTMRIRGKFKCHFVVSSRWQSNWIFWKNTKGKQNLKQWTTEEGWQDHRSISNKDKEENQKPNCSCLTSNSLFLLGMTQILKQRVNILEGNEYWLDSLPFTLHEKDGASLSGLDHSFTRIASSAAAACNNESRQHFNVTHIKNSISYHTQFSAEELLTICLL